MKDKFKKRLTLADVEKELSAIAQGNCKNPFEAELRVKALKAMADILLKSRQLGVEKRKALAPVTLTVIDSGAESQTQRIERLEESLKDQAREEGEI